MNRLSISFCVFALIVVPLRPLLRDIHQTISCAADRGDFLVHPTLSLNREPHTSFSRSYVQRPTFLLASDTGTPDWRNSMPFVQDDSQLTAHFLLDAIDVIDATGEIGVVLYVATEETKKNGGYDLRIVITQKRPSAKAYIYGKQGLLLHGSPPMRLDRGVKTKKPYLPWHDGMRQFYSLVCDRREDQVHLLLVQHTQEPVHNYTYAESIVRDILDDYSRHERLQNRPYAYFEQVAHMRCLPLPFTHHAYNLFKPAQQLSLSFAVLSGTIEITPA